MKGIRQRLESLFAGVADAIPTTGPLGRTTIPREISRPRGWVWELDLDGNYAWSSPEIERIVGISPDEVLGQPFHTMGFGSEAADLVKSQLETGEQIQQLLVDARHKDGASFQILIRAMHRVDATGATLGYRGVSQLVDPDTVSPERFVVEVPTPPEEIGATTPPIYAASWGTVMGFEDREGAIRTLDEPADPEAALSEDQENRLVIPLQVQDEIIGVIELEEKESGENWQDDDRALANAIAHELAITLQDARSYQLTQQALEEMREADRLKSQFLANMSHELRTPLNSIIGFSRVILKGIDGPITDPQEQDLNAIYNAGQHLLGLINNILDISKIEAGKMELAFTDVDLSEIIRGAMATAVGLVKDKPIELVTDIPQELPFVQADNIRIRQVLLNLVSNAAKFTEEGHIGVSARTIRRGNQNEVVIAVFDTGPGIDQDDQERIFEPFSQVDASPTRKTGGTGLGLSISRHLVELHGGVIWVESIPGEGSTFAFTLPYDPEFQFTRSSASLVLGVDSDPASLLTLREPMETAHYRFHALSRPEQAVQVSKALQPSAIILDLLQSDGQIWDLMHSLYQDAEIASRGIPTLLTDFNEHKDQGSFFPIHFWLPHTLTADEFSHRVKQLTPDGEESPSVLLINDLIPSFNAVLREVESQDKLEVHSSTDIREVEDHLMKYPNQLVLFNLIGLDDMIMPLEKWIAMIPPQRRIGLLPDPTELEESQAYTKAIQEWASSNSLDRLAFHQGIVELLQSLLPQEP